MFLEITTGGTRPPNPAGVRPPGPGRPPLGRGRVAFIMNCHSAPSSPSAGRGSGLNWSSGGSGNTLKPPDGGNAPAVRSSSGAKEMILFWVQNKLQDYPISITNFSTCWNDGLAFCALIHVFYPEAFDWSSLKPENRRYNFTLGFQAAEELADIYPLLEVDDMVRFQKPDWKCVFTYVQSFYRRFRDGRSPPRRSASPSTKSAEPPAQSAVALAVAEQTKEDEESKISKKKYSHPPMKLSDQTSIEHNKTDIKQALTNKDGKENSPKEAIKAVSPMREVKAVSIDTKIKQVNSKDESQDKENQHQQSESTRKISEARIQLSAGSNALRKSSFVKSYSCDVPASSEDCRPKCPVMSKAEVVSKSPTFLRSSSLEPSYQGKPKWSSPASEKEQSPIWVRNSNDSRPISPSRIKANERAKSPTMFKAASKERSASPGLLNATTIDGSPSVFKSHLKTVKSMSPTHDSPRVMLTPPPEDMKNLRE